MSQQTSATDASGRPQPSGLLFVYGLVLMNTISIGVINPVFPFLVKAISGEGDAGGAVIMGLFAASYAAMTFICAPIFGALSDHFGRRPLLLVATFGLAFDFVVIALAPTVAWLFFGRLISGITASSQSAAGAYVADVSTAADRVKNFGRFQAVASAGMVLGPAVGGLLATFDLRAPFWLAAFVCLANGVLGIFTLRESLPADRRTPFKWSRANPLGAMGLLTSHQGLLGLAAVFLLIQLASSSLTSVFQFYSHHRFGWGPMEIAFFLIALTAGSIVMQSFVAGPVSLKLGERRSILIGLTLSTFGYLFAGLANQPILFWISMIPLVLSSITHPNLQAMFAKRVKPTEQGQLHGVFAILGAMTGLLGPLAFTHVFAWSIGPGTAIALPGASILMGACICLGALGFAFIYARPSGPAEAPRPAPVAQGAAE